MASISKKSNGSYLVRVSHGTDPFGKQIIYSKTFKPSSNRLPPASLKRELNQFVQEFEAEIENNNMAPKRNMTFAEFCVEYLKIKTEALSPNTMVFYRMVIDTELMPLFGRMKLDEFRVYHVQQFIQYLTSKKRRDKKDLPIAGSTVKRYTTVLRSILSLAYKQEYIDEDISLSRRLVFPKTKITFL